MSFCDAGACPFKDECDHRTYRAAIVYAALEYAVYPAGPTSQAHRTTIGTFERGQGGFRQATTDLSVVMHGRDGEEWNEAWNEPGTAIGIATGLPSRLVVIDIDPPVARPVDWSAGPVTFADTVAPDNGPADAVRKWAADHGVLLPGNVVATTPSGAGRQHVWVRIPDGWTEPVPRKLGFFEHVDLCADNHSIKAPPSVRPATADKPGGEYTFVRGCPCEVPDASPELLRALIDTPAEATPVGRSNRDGSEAGDGEAIDIEGMSTVGVVHNQNFIFKQMACSMLARGWNAARGDSDTPSDVIIDVLMETADRSPQRADWPWTRHDMQRIEQAARAYIIRSRREEAERNRVAVKNLVRRFR